MLTLKLGTVSLGLATRIASIFYAIFVSCKMRTQTLAARVGITLQPQLLFSGILLAFRDSLNISLFHTVEQVQQVKQSLPCPRLHTLWEVSNGGLNPFLQREELNPVAHLVLAAERSTFSIQLHFKGKQQASTVLHMGPNLGAQSDLACPQSRQGSAWGDLDKWGQGLSCVLSSQHAQKWSCCKTEEVMPETPLPFMVKY